MSDGQNRPGRRLNYVSGISIHQAKKFFAYHFKEFFYLIKRNEEEWRYDIYILKTWNEIDEDTGKKVIYKFEDFYDLDEFKDYWGKGFHIIFLDAKDSDEEED